MYTNHKSALYVVAMLKQQGIKRIVISPGTSHNAMVRSIDEDSYFETFSVTDERSAAFFAIGLIQETQSPVAIMSTSGTATCNYISAVTEAYHRKLPLVVITADKHPYFLNQQEDQMINQPQMFKGITKHAVSLPETIHDERDDWYCRRLLNEVFLEMNHHGVGPIHINVPITYGIFAIGNTFTTNKLPVLPIIKRFDDNTKEEEWDNLFSSVKNKRLLILCGQNISFSSEEGMLLDKISKGFNCVIAKDPLSNLHIERALEVEKARPFTDELNPDIIISLDGSVVSFIKYKLKVENKKIEHWLVSESGSLSDPYRKLTYIFEGSSLRFLRRMAQHLQKKASYEYYQFIKSRVERFTVPELPYSSSYAYKEFLQAIPNNSILHLGNSSTIRITQFFHFRPDVQVYCNRGVHGIDGCMSTFIGQASVSPKLSYLLLGDLTFFYDMNALWNNHVGKNVRIMLINNGGASLFYFNTKGLKNFPSLDKNAAAAHISSAKGWVESRGFTYLCAQNQNEFDSQLAHFTKPVANGPILFEVFTDRAIDAEVWDSILAPYQPQAPQPSLKGKIKNKIKGWIK